MLAGRDSRESKALPRFPNISQYKPLRFVPLFGRILKGEFWGTPNLGEVRGSGVASIESPPMTSNTSQYKFCSICCRLATIPMSSFYPPIWGVKMGLGGQGCDKDVHCLQYYLIYIPGDDNAKGSDTCEFIGE